MEQFGLTRQYCVQKMQLLAHLDGVGVGSGVGVSKTFNIKVFYVMGKALSGKLSCPCDRSCL